MIFRLSEEKDLNDVLSLYNKVRGIGYCTWNEYYPTTLEINEDYKTANLFVLEENNKLIGAISIVPINELDMYPDWEIKDNAKEFARVVIDPAYQNKGYAKVLVENILNELKSRNVHSVHISVAKSNIIAQKLYQHFNFKILNEYEMYGSIYYLYEKEL